MANNPDQKSTKQTKQAVNRRVAARQRKERRRRMWMIGTPIFIVLVLIMALIIVKLSTGTKSAQASSLAPADLVNTVTTVPVATFEAVGKGSAQTLPTPITGTALTSTDGKPRIVYLGAEYCPYCAAERWAVVTALSRFGTWQNLSISHSSSSDVYPNTPTFSFHGASFTSPYVSFDGVETLTNQRSGNGYKPLDTPTADETALQKQYDSSGSIPFIDIGNKFVINGATYDPSILGGKTHQQVASQLSSSTNAISQGVIGAANTITAAICSITNNQPATVCGTTMIANLQQQIATAKSSGS